jgi:hypothetical protein
MSEAAEQSDVPRKMSDVPRSEATFCEKIEAKAERKPTNALRWSAALTLFGLALMVWSMLQPTPLPIMLAMTFGQLVGTTAFAIYIWVIVRELRRRPP